MSELRPDQDLRVAAPKPPLSGRRAVTALVALGAVAAFGIGIWYAYNQGIQRANQGTLPLVKADQGPTKVAPDNPGGMQVPNQDKQIYDKLGNDRSAQNGVERLLPPPERPLAAGAAPPIPGPQAASPASNDPKALPSVSVPNRNTNVAPTGVSPGSTTAAPPAAAPAPTAAPPPAAPTQQLAAAAPPVAKPATSGSTRIQVAAYRDTAAAQAAWQKLQKKLPDLAALTPTYEKADLGEKGIYYRLQIGPFADRGAASGACEKLKAAGEGCILVGK